MRVQLGKLSALIRWSRRSWSLPAPDFIKRSVLQRFGIPSSPWLETGTYHGRTTEFLASSAELHPPLVISLEPTVHFFRSAQARLHHLANVELFNAASEEAFEDQLCRLRGAPANFWLDGHYSGGPTMLFKGKATPIEHELATIAMYSSHFPEMAVFVDDTRLFANSLTPQDGYPPQSLLIEWADGLGLRWHIEHDIFVARGRPIR